MQTQSVNVLDHEMIRDFCGCGALAEIEGKCYSCWCQEQRFIEEAESIEFDESDLW